jgi:hypothetical protein
MSRSEPAADYLSFGFCGCSFGGCGFLRGGAGRWRLGAGFAAATRSLGRSCACGFVIRRSGGRDSRR